MRATNLDSQPTLSLEDYLAYTRRELAGLQAAAEAIGNTSISGRVGGMIQTWKIFVKQNYNVELQLKDLFSPKVYQE